MISKKNGFISGWVILALVVFTVIGLIILGFGEEIMAARKEKANPTPTNTITGTLHLIESTTYRYPEQKWTSQMRELQYKNHSYIYLSGHHTIVHAAHCSCFSTNTVR
jgi:hypothetical protein